MEEKKINPNSIPGWGIDADPKDHPNYPIKKYTGDDHKRSNWKRPTLTNENIEILKSTERPQLSAVYGSKTPPRFLSGLIRRFAYSYSENMYRHWVPLLLADRVDIIESDIIDALKGHFPNLIKELGWTGLSKVDKDLMIKKILKNILITGIAVSITALIVKRR